jgi:plasmid maintenance system antidote protein VapI
LTGRPRRETTDTMTTMSETLREAIRAADLPLLQLAEASGVQRASLSRFLRGERTLRLDMADRLATYFGLELKPKHPKPQNG